MALGETFDLARIFSAAEQIKGARRQEADDLLRRQYMQTQIAGSEQAQKIQGEQHQSVMDERIARKSYYLTQAVLGSPDPKAAAEAIAPEFVQEFEKKHGSGSWKNLTPEQAVQAAQAIQSHAIGVIGPQQKVKWVDNGGQLTAIDETTGQPIRGVAPIDKTVSPDSALSAQTSMRGQDLAADTAAASRAVTARGQDLSADTARRGQDLTAKTAADVSGPAKSRGEAQKLRKEFEGLQTVQNYRAVEPLVKSAQQAPDNGYGDLDIIYAVGKILDPASVVREGELKLTIDAGSPLQKLLGKTRFNFEQGGRLTPKQREQVLGMLKGRAGAVREAYDREKQRFAGYAESAGLEAGAVVGEDTPAPQASPQAEMTATGPNGQKIVLRNGQWVPFGGR